MYLGMLGILLRFLSTVNKEVNLLSDFPAGVCMFPPSHLFNLCFHKQK